MGAWVGASFCLLQPATGETWAPAVIESPPRRHRILFLAHREAHRHSSVKKGPKARFTAASSYKPAKAMRRWKRARGASGSDGREAGGHPFRGVSSGEQEIYVRTHFTTTVLEN